MATPERTDSLLYYAFSIHIISQALIQLGELNIRHLFRLSLVSYKMNKLIKESIEIPKQLVFDRRSAYSSELEVKIPKGEPIKKWPYWVKIAVREYAFNYHHVLAEEKLYTSLQYGVDVFFNDRKRYLMPLRCFQGSLKLSCMGHLLSRGEKVDWSKGQDCICAKLGSRLRKRGIYGQKGLRISKGKVQGLTIEMTKDAKKTAGAIQRLLTYQDHYCHKKRKITLLRIYWMIRAVSEGARNNMKRQKTESPNPSPIEDENSCCESDLEQDVAADIGEALGEDTLVANPVLDKIHHRENFNIRIRINIPLENQPVSFQTEEYVVPNLTMCLRKVGSEYYVLVVGREYDWNKKGAKIDPVTKLPKRTGKPASRTFLYAVIDENGKVHPTSRYLKQVTLSYEYNTEVVPQKGCRDLEKFLVALNDNFWEISNSLGLLGNACVFCGKTLTDDKSLKKGYGPDCAKKWGLQDTIILSNSVVTNDMEEIKKIVSVEEFIMRENEKNNVSQEVMENFRRLVEDQTNPKNSEILAKKPKEEPKEEPKKAPEPQKKRKNQDSDSEDDVPISILFARK